jgi:cell division protein FtsL
MKYQKKILIIFSATFITLCISIIISELDFTHCDYRGYCTDVIGSIFGQGLGFLSLSTLPVLFFLLFTKKAVYETWKKFALIFVPIVALWVLAVPSSCGGFLPMCLTKELVSMFSAILLLIISILIIAIQSWKHRDKTKQIFEQRDNLDSFITKKEKMDFSDTELIKQAIVSAEGNKNDEEIKETLLKQGFQEKDITKAFDEIKKEATNKK